VKHIQSSPYSAIFATLCCVLHCTLPDKGLFAQMHYCALWGCIPMCSLKCWEDETMTVLASNSRKIPQPRRASTKHWAGGRAHPIRRAHTLISSSRTGSACHRCHAQICTCIPIRGTAGSVTEQPDRQENSISSEPHANLRSQAYACCCGTAWCLIFICNAAQAVQ